MVPIYHMFVFRDFAEEECLLREIVARSSDLAQFRDSCFISSIIFLRDFWVQFWNSTVIAASVGALTLFIATCAAFSISRLRVPGGRTVVESRAVDLFHSGGVSRRARCTAPWAITACSTPVGR